MHVLVGVGPGPVEVLAYQVTPENVDIGKEIINLSCGCIFLSGYELACVVTTAFLFCFFHKMAGQHA